MHGEHNVTLTVYVCSLFEMSDAVSLFPDRSVYVRGRNVMSEKLLGDSFAVRMFYAGCGARCGNTWGPPVNSTSGIAFVLLYPSFLTL